MINSFKCDKCGTTFAPYDLREVGSQSEMLELKCIYNEKGEATLDLCPECYKELSEWFNS